MFWYFDITSKIFEWISSNSGCLTYSLPGFELWWYKPEIREIESVMQTFNIALVATIID